MSRDRRRIFGNETRGRLLEWEYDQAPSERFSAAVLLADGYTGLDPSHPLGGQDGGKDAVCEKDGVRMVMACYFPRGQQTLKVIEDKFRDDAKGIKKNDAKGIVFVTNQELKLGEREGLQADEPTWWYGRGSFAELAAAPRAVEPPLVTPLPSDEIQPKAKPQLSLFNPADKADSLPLPTALVAKLANDEKAVLVLLKENGSARASELAQRLNKNPGRLNGLMRALRRSLHTEGFTLFTDEVLPNGETMYRYLRKEER